MGLAMEKYWSKRVSAFRDKDEPYQNKPGIFKSFSGNVFLHLNSSMEQAKKGYGFFCCLVFCLKLCKANDL